MTLMMKNPDKASETNLKGIAVKFTDKLNKRPVIGEIK
jgi:hypothetical protein